MIIKKITAMFCLFILCSTMCIAQGKIRKADFERLIDYANCKYLITFIESCNYNEDVSYVNYEKKIKPELHKASLENFKSIPDFNKISALLKDINNKAAIGLAETINERKSKYDNSPDNNDLLEIIKAEKWKYLDSYIDLSTTANKVLADIYNKYNLDIEQITVNTTKDNLQTLQQRVDFLESQINELKSEKSKFWFLLIALIVTWIVVFLLFLINRKRDRNRNQIINTVLNSNRIRSEFISNTDYTSNTQLTEKRITTIENQINRFHEDSNRKKKEINEHSETKTSKYTKDKYFKTKSENILTDELNNSTDASFRVFNITGNDAKFEYCGKVVNQDFFTDVCSFVNNPSDIPNKTKIITTTPGTVKKDGNGNWEVIEKAKIKFE